jgi:hypothetical protein
MNSLCSPTPQPSESCLRTRHDEDGSNIPSIDEYFLQSVSRATLVSAWASESCKPPSEDVEEDFGRKRHSVTSCIESVCTRFRPCCFHALSAGLVLLHSARRWTGLGEFHTVAGSYVLSSKLETANLPWLPYWRLILLFTSPIALFSTSVLRMIVGQKSSLSLPLCWCWRRRRLPIHPRRVTIHD